MALHLYHWTCEHSAGDIRADGMLVRPNPPSIGFSWWTDLDQPGRRTRRALGLTSVIQPCDRMVYRCEAADPTTLTHWPEHPWSRRPEWQLLHKDGITQPEHWWVADDPVLVRSIRRIGV